MRYLLCLLMLMTGTLIAEQGNVVHSFEKGKIQLLSEATDDGRVVVLLKPLKANTSVQKISVNPKTLTLSFLMLVEKENAPCASWVDCQPVYVQLDPKRVGKISLEGKVVESLENVTVLMP